MSRISYEYFRFSDPERSYDIGLTVFPSITDYSLWRADYGTDLRLELEYDLLCVLSLYATYDSDPISEE